MNKTAVAEFIALKEKKAAGGDILSHMGHAAGGAAAAGAVGLGMAGIAGAVSKIVDAATKSHDFHQMLGANEDLHEHYNSNPKQFNLMFNTLRNMNPQFSKDPLVAGAFMRQMVSSPNGIGGFASQMLEHRRDFPEGTMDGVMDTAREGLKAGISTSMRQH